MKKNILMLLLVTITQNVFAFSWETEIEDLIAEQQKETTSIRKDIQSIKTAIGDSPLKDNEILVPAGVFLYRSSQGNLEKCNGGTTDNLLKFRLIGPNGKEFDAPVKRTFRTGVIKEMVCGGIEMYFVNVRPTFFSTNGFGILWNGADSYILLVKKDDIVKK